MRKIRVNVQPSYPIYIDRGARSSFSGIIRHALDRRYFYVVISNPTVYAYHGKTLERALRAAKISHTHILIKDSEKTKSWDALGRLLAELAHRCVGTKPALIAFGGGVISDITGFAAAVFKRGIPYVSIPTTLLAQVDAAVGGKTAVDLACGKNLAGTFYQPRAVIVNVGFLATLPDEIYRDGLAEVVKYAVIQDRAFFDLLERDYQRLLRREAALLEKVVAQCLAIKADIVSRDEKETKSIRTVLNFGHTVAHAIEAASGYAYSHGNAVALGMRAATRIAVRSGVCNKETERAITQLLERLRLPARRAQKKIATRTVMRYLDYDKKRVGATNRFVLPRRIGKVIIKENIASTLIARAVRETIV